MWNIPFFPPTASKEGEAISLLYWAISWLAIIFGSIVLFGAVYLAVKYRASNHAVRRDDAPETDLRMELGWTLVPLILALAIFGWAAKLYGDIYAPREGAYEVFVIGKQWMWHCQHSNGVRENNELHLPAGRLVKVTLISQDVIHSFSIPAFRVKRDTVPGRYNTMFFTPTKPGKYHLFCTEYCGTKHSEMIGSVYVLPPEEFQQWLDRGGRGGAVATAAVSLEEQGKQVFAGVGACNSCHMNPNSAVKAPDLRGRFGQKVKLADGRTVVADEAYIRESILNPGAKVVAGYQNVMPPYQGVLSEEQIIQLTAYIKSLANEKPAGGQ
jgi:cytochrome c oxidase subunit 2